MLDTMKKIALLAPVLALAACGSEAAPAPEPTPAETVAAAEPEEPALPPPDEDVFAATFAKTCPSAEAVNTSVCKRAAMGSPEVICEYGLGDDEYLRHEATLVEGETEWEIADAEAVCAKH